MVLDGEAVACRVIDNGLMDNLEIDGLPRGTTISVLVGDDQYSHQFMERSHIFELPPREPGSEYDVGFEFETADGWVPMSCGVKRTLTLEELGLVCTVELYQGRPMLTAAGPGLTEYLGDGENVGHLKTTFNSLTLDMRAETGIHNYQVHFGLTEAGPQTVDCGQIEVPEVDVEQLITAARDFRFPDMAQRMEPGRTSRWMG